MFDFALKMFDFAGEERGEECHLGLDDQRFPALRDGARLRPLLLPQAVGVRFYNKNEDSSK